MRETQSVSVGFFDFHGDFAVEVFTFQNFHTECFGEVVCAFYFFFASLAEGLALRYLYSFWNSGASPPGEKMTIKMRTIPIIMRLMGGPTLLTPGNKPPMLLWKASATLGRDKPSEAKIV